MNTQSEFDFLKDQVNRLNGVLSYYQKMHSEHPEKTGNNDIKLVFNNHTTPLLLEYDKIIFEMTEEIKLFKAHIDQEQLRVKTITKENERLWNQLNDALKDSKNSFTDQTKQNMQAQIDLMIKEKNNLQELLRITELEVNRLQNEITENNMKPQTILFNEKIESMKQMHLNSMKELENEAVGNRDIKRDLCNELEKYRKQNSEYEKENKILNDKLKFEKQATEENLSQLKSSLKRIDFLTNEKRELLETVDELKGVIKNHDSVKNEWSYTLADLESKYNEKEKQFYEATQKVSEAYKIVENAETEKKAVELKETQVVNECERLRGVIAGILDDAGVRTKEEVDLVTTKYEKEIERVMEELTLCEENRQELLVELDQIKRSKTQLEQEIDTLHKIDREKNLQEYSSEEINHNRAIKAEREREELRLQMQTLENSFVKEKIEWQRQKEALETEISYVQKKLANLQISCDKVQSNADRFSKLLLASEESASKHRKKYQESLRNHRHEYELLKQSSHIKQQELETKLISAEETQRHTTSEMRQFLNKQQQMSSKWREEAHSLSEQYEQKINQLSKEHDRQKKRNEEMILLLHESKQKILESQEVIDDQKQTIAMMEKQIHISQDPSSSRFDMDPLDPDDSGWQLQKLKKQQQRMIKESVARKYDFSAKYNSNKEGNHSG